METVLGGLGGGEFPELLKEGNQQPRTQLSYYAKRSSKQRASTAAQPHSATDKRWAPYCRAFWAWASAGVWNTTLHMTTFMPGELSPA